MSTLASRLTQALAGPPKRSQAALAAACGVKPPSVSDWLSGRTKSLEGANLLNAAKFLQVRPEWLASGTPPMRGQEIRESATVSYLPSQSAGRGDLILDLAGDLAEEIADSEQIERGSRRFMALHSKIVKRLELAFAASPVPSPADLVAKAASRSPEETKNAERGPEEEAGQGSGGGRKGAAARKPAARGKRKP